MTCKNCIHFEACKNILEAVNPDYKGKNITVESVCEVFKNKSDYAKVKHGYWIYDAKDEYFFCSQCELSALNNYRGLSADSEYCPHCGAKMDGKDDSEVII